MATLAQRCKALEERVDDQQRSIEAQEQLLAQVIVSIAEMTTAVELVIASTLEGMDEEGVARFQENFTEQRKQIIDFLASTTTESAPTEDRIAAAAAQYMAEPIHAQPAQSN